VPGDTAKSILWYRITHVSNPLTSAQIGQICTWILDGAQNTQCEPSGDCDTTAVTYSNFVLPTIKNYCLGCHSGRSAEACNGLDFSTYKTVALTALQGRMMDAIKNNSPHMPLNGPQLDDCTIAKIAAWIDQGALNN
jgi:cytochrome c553